MADGGSEKPPGRDLDLFHGSTGGDTDHVAAWLDDIGFGPSMGLTDPRRYWALYWLDATRMSVANEHGEQEAEDYFCMVRSRWRGDNVDIDAVFESPDFAIGVMVPHAWSLDLVLELLNGDSSAGTGGDASDY